MISVFAPNRMDDHIRDIFAVHVLPVSDTLKKGQGRQKFGAQKTRRAARCNPRGVACHYRFPPRPYDPMETP